MLATSAALTLNPQFRRIAVSCRQLSVFAAELDELTKPCSEILDG